MNVTGHRDFQSAEDSLESLRWRNDQYLGYEALMPFECPEGASVLDLGCGPGHDLVGFATRSAAGRIIGADVSTSSLSEAAARCDLHGREVEFIQLAPENPKLPLPDESIDLVHCSGVIHHIPEPAATLKEIFRVLKPRGRFRCMNYNRDSLFFHLYAGWIKRHEEAAGLEKLSTDDAFTSLTDGADCPISRAWSPATFIAMASACGFAGRHTGNAISAFEMGIQLRRFEAIVDPRLEREHREFLRDVVLGPNGIPCNRSGDVAGVDACYELSKS